MKWIWIQETDENIVRSTIIIHPTNGTNGFL